MPWKRVERQIYLCDNCSAPLISSYDFDFNSLHKHDEAYASIFKTDADLSEYEVGENGWEEIGGNWYCPDCWHWCARDETVDEMRPGPVDDCCLNHESWYDLLSWEEKCLV